MSRDDFVSASIKAVRRKGYTDYYLVLLHKNASTGAVLKKRSTRMAGPSWLMGWLGNLPSEPWMNTEYGWSWERHTSDESLASTYVNKLPGKKLDSIGRDI